MKVNDDIKEILNILGNPPENDVKLINEAYEFAAKAHAGQKRFSGEPYIVHPLETAKTLAHLRLDAKTIAAGLLHDVCEDNESINRKDLEKRFGKEIAFLVDGVTKLGKLRYQGVEREVENLRKMLMAMAKDIRVILIRLADRLHNMKTLRHVRPEKQKRIAMETMEIYAPLASRLGIGEIKGQLEDLAFQYIDPEAYAKVMEMIKGRYEQKERDLARVRKDLRKALDANGLGKAKIDSRVKRIYSLYRKLLKPENDMNMNKIYDLIALRVRVDTVEECYKALGIIHKMWRPLPGRIKDFIALPKINGYQSLHTTVFASGGKITEIQIRTEKMHEEAEHGIAAHWLYSESGKVSANAKLNPRLAWVNQLVDWQKSIPAEDSGDARPRDFLETLRIDFFKNRVFCFTPKGDVIDLPEGSSVIDFAYAVHSEIGNSAAGALVNDKFVSLDTELKNGDIVEIQTQKNKKPSMQWLNHAQTSIAKKHIKSRLKKESLFEKIK